MDKSPGKAEVIERKAGGVQYNADPWDLAMNLEDDMLDIDGAIGDILNQKEQQPNGGNAPIDQIMDLEQFKQVCQQYKTLLITATEK